MVKIPNGYEGTNEVYTYNTATRGEWSYYYNADSYPPENTYVHKYGITTGYTFGQIVSTDFVSAPSTTTYGTVCVQSLDRDNNMGEPGDSGAPVWYTNAQNERILMGIATSCQNRLTNPDQYPTMYYTPIKKAIDAGFTPTYIEGCVSIA